MPEAVQGAQDTKPLWSNGMWSGKSMSLSPNTPTQDAGPPHMSLAWQGVGSPLRAQHQPPHQLLGVRVVLEGVAQSHGAHGRQRGDCLERSDLLGRNE